MHLLEFIEHFNECIIQILIILKGKRWHLFAVWHYFFVPSRHILWGLWSVEKGARRKFAVYVKLMAIEDDEVRLRRSQVSCRCGAFNSEVRPLGGRGGGYLNQNPNSNPNHSLFNDSVEVFEEVLNRLRRSDLTNVSISRVESLNKHFSPNLNALHQPALRYPPSPFQA